MIMIEIQVAILLLVNHAYCIKTPRTPIISIIVWKEDALLPAMFNLLHVQQYKSTTVKKNFCNQSNHYEN